MFLVFHLVASAASLGKKTAIGGAVRQLTAPYERVFGIWQSWGMFGPPPAGGTWQFAAGVTADGEEVPVKPIVGELSHDRTEVHYDRMRKVERNMFDKKNAPLRQSVAEWICRREAAEGRDFTAIHLWKERDITPKPHLRKERVESGTVGRKVIEQETWPCP